MFEENMKLPIGELSPETAVEYADYIWDEYEKEMKSSNPSDNGFQEPIDNILDEANSRNMEAKISKISEIEGALYTESLEEYNDRALSSDSVDYLLIIEGKTVKVNVTQQAWVKIEVTKSHKLEFYVRYPKNELFVTASVNGIDIELNDLWDDEEDPQVLLDAV